MSLSISGVIKVPEMIQQQTFYNLKQKKLAST